MTGLFGIYWGAIIVALPLLFGSSNPDYEVCTYFETFNNGDKVFKCTKGQVFSFGVKKFDKFMYDQVSKSIKPILVQFPKGMVKANKGKNTREFRDQFLIFFALLSVCLFGFRKNLLKVDRLFVGLSSFLLIVALTNSHELISNNHYGQWLMFSIGLMLLAQFICNFNKEDKKPIIIAMGFACCLQSFLVMISYFGIDPYIMAVNFIFNKVSFAATKNLGPDVIASGSLLNPHVAGLFIAITLPALWKKPILLIMGIVGLLLTTSIVPIIAFVAGGIIVFYSKFLKRKHFIKITLACAAIFITIFTLSLSPVGFFSNNSRYSVFLQALIMPRGLGTMFGEGLGYFADFHQTIFKTRMRYLQVHNEYIELYVAFGMIGVMAIGYYLVAKKDQILKADTAFLWSFAVALASSVGSFTFHVAPVALVALIAAGFCFKKEPCYVT